MSIDPAIQTLFIFWFGGSAVLLVTLLVLEGVKSRFTVLRGPIAGRTLDALQSVAMVAIMFTVLFAMFFAFLSLA